MTPRSKLLSANALMLLGIMPLLLVFIWIILVISYAQQHKGVMGGSDAFLMIGALFVTYVFAALVAGSSALWSVSIVKRNAGVRMQSATIMKTMVAIALVAPLVWYAGISFRLF